MRYSDREGASGDFSLSVESFRWKTMCQRSLHVPLPCLLGSVVPTNIGWEPYKKVFSGNPTETIYSLRTQASIPELVPWGGQNVMHRYLFSELQIQLSFGGVLLAREIPEPQALGNKWFFPFLCSGR